MFEHAPQENMAVEIFALYLAEATDVMVIFSAEQCGQVVTKYDMFHPPKSLQIIAGDYGSRLSE